MDFASVHNRCIANILSLNSAKSSFLIITPKMNMQQPSTTLNLNNIPLFRYNGAKCLEIYNMSINN